MGFTCLLCNKPKYKKFKANATFHSFPKCPIQRQVWMNICNVTDQIDLKYRKICSYHFTPECFNKNSKKRLLNSDAIPTIFVKRFMKKENFEAGFLEESLLERKGRNSCILCVKSEISYTPSYKIPLHLFPKCPKKRQEWINRCQLKDEEVLPHHKICSLHFEHTSYKPNGKRWTLVPNAMPTIFELGRYYNRIIKKKVLKVKITPADRTA